MMSYEVKEEGQSDFFKLCCWGHSILYKDRDANQHCWQLGSEIDMMDLLHEL